MATHQISAVVQDEPCASGHMFQVPHAAHPDQLLRYTRTQLKEIVKTANFEWKLNIECARRFMHLL